MKSTSNGMSGTTPDQETSGATPKVTVKLTEMQYDQLLVIVDHYAATCPVNLTPDVREIERALQAANEPVA